jgi:creatinine amidohydrolase
VLNTGVSTRRPLAAAADVLKSDGILLRFTDLSVTEPVEKTIRKEPGGTHADEIETSMLLYMSPMDVDMSKAVKDYHPGAGGLTRDPNQKGRVYSPSGVFGDPTLATREKGRTVTEALVETILKEIEELRKAPLPASSAPVVTTPRVR